MKADVHMPPIGQRAFIPFYEHFQFGQRLSTLAAAKPRPCPFAGERITRSPWSPWTARGKCGERVGFRLFSTVLRWTVESLGFCEFRAGDARPF